MSKILLSLIFLIGAGHLYYQYTGNFRSEYILPADSYSLPVNLPELDESQDILGLLEQPFYYAGHGHQTFVFISEDGKTVLKLFMKDYIRSDWVRYLLPPLPPFRQWMLHEGENHHFRRKRLLSGYALCYTLDKENCGLLYLHVDQKAPTVSIQVIDALGFSHRIPSDQVVFALQKKATVTKEVLRDRLSREDIEGAREAIDQILALYREQFDKGLVDRDRNFLENTGFVDGRPIRTDVGKVVWNDGKYSFEHEYGKIIDKRLARWMDKYYPNTRF